MSKIANQDHYGRISYLFQASSMMAKIGNEELSRCYSKTMRSVAMKNVLRMSPRIKRQVCKKCNRIQIPGYTCTTRLENHSKSQEGRNDVLVYTCDCGHKKRFPVGKDPNYKLWMESVVDE